MKKYIEIFVNILLLFSTCLCIFVVYSTVSTGNANINGMQAFYVVSGSMEPTIPVGSILVTKEQEDYDIGDIITFESQDIAIQGAPNTHRVVDKELKNYVVYYTTKGDANNQNDLIQSTSDDIYGKVIWYTDSLKWVAIFIGYITTSQGFLCLVILPLLFLSAKSVDYFSKALKEQMKVENKGIQHNMKDGE